MTKGGARMSHRIGDNKVEKCVLLHMFGFVLFYLLNMR
jgi:hypothetical protein